MKNIKKTKRVLLIDDDEDLQELLSMYLEIEGYITIAAQNGMEATRILQDQEVDIIVVDLMMPVMDGMRFLRWLRIEQKKSLPVLVLTAVEKESVERDLIETGASGVVYKPLDPDDLLEKMRNLVH